MYRATGQTLVKFALTVLLLTGAADLAAQGMGGGGTAPGGQAPAEGGIAAAEPEMSHGEYVARLGNCTACHTVADGKPFAGGLKMEVPWLGAIYATNITPDRETGIGDYSFEEFDRAMREGVAKDGHRLYPAMPYPSYSKMTEEDMRALYDFFMYEVEPVRQPNYRNEIPDHLEQRWTLGIWNALFVPDEPYQTKPDQSDEWNRGAYLVQGLGHCGACHTPRGFGFQEKAYDESDPAFLAGAPLDFWSAPSLNGDQLTGLGRWTEEDVVDLLLNGRNTWGPTFGTMIEVVNHSTQYLTDEDARAIAVYLKSLPAVNDQPDWSYDDSTTQKLLDGRLDEEPGVGTYLTLCASCHGHNGGGYIPFLPPLAGNPSVLDPDPSSLINVTLNGSLRLLVGGEPSIFDMPYNRDQLDDQEVADVLNFIRNGWGNSAAPVTAEQVAEVRAGTDASNDDVLVLQMK